MNRKRACQLIPYVFLVFSSCQNLREKKVDEPVDNVLFRIQKSAILSETYSSIKLSNIHLIRDDGEEVYFNELVSNDTPVFCLIITGFCTTCIEKQLAYYNSLSQTFDDRVVLIGRYERLNDLRSVKINLNISHHVYLMKDDIFDNYYNEPISFVLRKGNYMIKTKFHNNISSELTSAYYDGVRRFMSFHDMH